MHVVRRLVRGLLLLVIVVLCVMGAAGAATQTPWFRNWLRQYVAAEANEFFNGRLEIGRLSGNLFHGVALENVTVTVAGEQIAAFPLVRLEYNVFHFVSRGISIDRLVINHPHLMVRRDDSGWSVGDLIRKDEGEADRSGPGRPFRVDGVEINEGEVVLDDRQANPSVALPHEVKALNARLSFAYQPVRYSLQVASLTFATADPDAAVTSFSGGVTVRDDTVFFEQIAAQTDQSALQVDGAIHDYLSESRFEFRAHSTGLSLKEAGRFVPAIARDLSPSFDLTLNGPLENLSVTLDTRVSGGAWAKARFVVDAFGPQQALNGELSVRHLDLAPLLADAGYASDLNADITAHLKSASLSDVHGYNGDVAVSLSDSQAMGYRVQSARLDSVVAGPSVKVRSTASAYGSTMTADGTLSMSPDSERASYELSGVMRHVNLARLPRTLTKTAAPATELNARYRAAGVEPLNPKKPAARKAAVDTTFEDSTVPGATIESGTLASVKVEGERVSYSADATLAGVDLVQLGEALAVPALADERYRSNLNARVTARGEGTSLDSMQLTANGTVTNTTLLGAELNDMTFDASLEHKIVTVKASGVVSNGDPSIATGRADLQGQLGGRFDVDATMTDVGGAVTPESIDGTLQLTLDPGTLSGVELQSASVDVTYRDDVADVRKLEVTGPGLNINGQGTVVLADEGSSDFALSGTGLNLETVGQLASVPISGLAKVDLHVTGNRRELRADGTVQGNEVKYGDNGALAVTSSVNAAVPDLSVEDATLVADTTATFVSLGGQDINQIKGKATYTGHQLQFDGTADQPQRSVRASGALTLHPDHQEVHLTRLDLTASGQTWRVPNGEEAAITYGQDQVSIDRLRLVNGAQSIEVAGQFGQPGETLQVSAQAVDLSGVDALLLRPPQFSGQLNASATVNGTWSSPEVQGEFAVANGGFKQFKYESLKGTVGLSGNLATVDARLQQNESQWLTAKGVVPVAAFQPSPEEESGGQPGHVEPGSTPDEFNLAIDSSPIGLGVVSGFTTAVTDVTGTLELHVKVIGAARDPHPSGAITVADAAARVPVTGVLYNHINGRVDLQPDRVHIDQLTVLDNHASALSLTGDLAVHEREVGGVRIFVNASDFKVFDNELGDLRLETAMELGGQLTAPQIRGYLGVSTGRINADRILATVGPSPYKSVSTEQKVAAETSTTPTPGSPWDATTVDVKMTIPDDLVVRATELEVPGAPVGLGRLIVTLGGDLTATKEAGAALKLVGDIQTIRGTYDFQSRRFDFVRGGTIRFEGQPEINPALNLTLRREIQGVEARVNITGNISAPAIALSSTPPLEQADILSLIVFNQPINELGTGQQASLAARAQSIAAGAVTGQIANSIGSALNLDTFDITVGPESGSTAQVTLGQQIGRGLFVKLQQGVGDSSNTNVIVEYEFLKWLRLQSNFVTGSQSQQSMFRRAQGSGADLIILFQK